MAAPYSALVSLLNTITMEQTPRHYLPHQISFNGGLLESLKDRVNFLVEFLEQGWKEAVDLEGCIVKAAYSAEDAIHFYISDQVLFPSTRSRKLGSGRFCRDLTKIIEDFDSIKTLAVQIKERSEHDDLHPRSKTYAGSSSNAPHYFPKDKMVGFDDLKDPLVQLLAGNQSKREVISIVGMGGMGKSTLASNVYNDKYMLSCFEIRVWVTVSQEYNVRDILRKVLRSIIREDKSSNMNEDTLEVDVYQNLYGRKYLIVLDDMWTTEGWKQIEKFFPDNNNHSRIVVTTRLSNVAKECSSSSITMKFLDEVSSWNLLCNKVFSKETCPVQLEQIGQRIANNCRGFPLLISTIAGWLAKSELTPEYWERVANNVQSTKELDREKHCLKVLHLSYSHLPVHLKPCLLYMGKFPEDHGFRVSELFRSWVAKGLIKPSDDERMEEIAEKIFKDLVERNLVLVREGVSSGKAKLCYIHDLVRDVCLEEGKRNGTFYAERYSSIDHHIVFNPSILGEIADRQVCHLLESRSIFWKGDSGKVFRFGTPTILRVSNQVDTFHHKSDDKNDCYPPGSVPHYIVQSWYEDSRVPLNSTAEVIRSCFTRNLQMLTGRSHKVMAPSEIWNMQQLRHIMFKRIQLPEPPSDCIILENLQTLLTLENFVFDEEVVKRIPNIQKLKILYENSFWKDCKGSHYGLNNLGYFQKLESLACYFYASQLTGNLLLQSFVLPKSLRKLTLHGCRFEWKDIRIIGTLPNLEVLKLWGFAFEGHEWNQAEGEFKCLKYLEIRMAEKLEIWTADEACFPRLEKPVLAILPKLRKIPQELGNIPDLRLIKLIYCTDSAIQSAKAISDEQESYENADLEVGVYINEEQKELLSLAGGNFHIQVGAVW